MSGTFQRPGRSSCCLAAPRRHLQPVTNGAKTTCNPRFCCRREVGTAYDTQSKYMIAFYKRYLEDDERYDDVPNAAPDMALSKYEHKP